jgi:beta-lactamase regulating signal transducer with metallopeptidase domain
MNRFHEFCIVVFAQLTGIMLAAALLACMTRRHAANRHAIGLIALVLTLASPALALALPRPAWWDVLTSPSDRVHASVGAPEPHWPTEPTIVAPAEGPSDPVQEEPRLASEPSTAKQQPRPAPTPVPHDREPEPARLTAPAPPARVSNWPNWALNLAVGTWAAGIVVLAFRLARSQRRVQQLRFSIQASTISRMEFPVLSSLLDNVCQTLGVRQRPALAVSQRTPLPMLFGLWRPVIVLPSELATSAPTGRLRDVLVHECAHLVRRDPWVNLAQRVATVMFWIHPGLYWLNRQIERAREEICDNYVLLHADRADYSQMLLELAERAARHTTFPALGILGSRWTLEQRIAGLLDPNRLIATRTRRRNLLAVALLVGSMTAMVGGVGAFPGKRPGQQTAAANPTAEVQPGKASPALRKIAIHGTSQDSQHKPIANASVRVFRYASAIDPPVLLAQTKTDGEGRYRLRNIEIPAAREDAMGGNPILVATANGYVSEMRAARTKTDDLELPLEMDNNPGTLSGVVTDRQGRPIPGVSVFALFSPLPGVATAVTDAQGHYAITDLKRWMPEETKRFDPKTGLGTMTSSCTFRLSHPDYPLTMASNTGIPQTVNVTLKPAAVVEGRVIDSVTNQPAKNVTVSAQGIVKHGWFQTRTDQRGRYRLAMTRDYYNIWAAAEDRIAIAVKARSAEPGKTVSGGDIQLVRGGFVVGTVFDAATNRPVSSTADHPIYVAHYGPSRPHTGAAVTSTAVNGDGTYRLRVAPGRNYVYLMSGHHDSANVDVEDGRDTKLDLRFDDSPHKGGYPVRPLDPDEELAMSLRETIEAEDANVADPNGTSARKVSAAVPQARRDTPTGRLLDELAKHNRRQRAFTDPWCRTLKEIVDLGPAAVPQLIEELDATDDDMMLRCLGFTLRAIGDKRAIPGLIRAIPKTLRRAGSDMGLRSQDANLVKFMQQNGLKQNAAYIRGNQYSFGRPIREIFGALEALSGRAFDEEELYGVFSGGMATQELQRRRLFQRTASKWADWWEQHWREYVQDVAYSHVNLAAAKDNDDNATAPKPGAHFKTVGGGSNYVLQSVFDPNARTVFYDLDTGRTAGLPAKWRDGKITESQLDEIVTWAAQEGFDLMGTEYVSPGDGRKWFAIRPIGLRAWELGKERWKMQSANITAEALQAEGTPARELLLPFDREKGSYAPESTATFVFTTREGTPGLLFVGIEVRDTNVKFGLSRGDSERNPSHLFQGRRFAWTSFEEVAGDSAQSSAPGSPRSGH